MTGTGTEGSRILTQQTTDLPGGRNRRTWRRESAAVLVAVVAWAVAAGGVGLTQPGQRLAEIVWKMTAPCPRGQVALTFDDGPDGSTQPMLAVLRDYGVRATFFVIGEKVAKHPDLVRAEAAAGHSVQNHTWDHPRLGELAGAQVHDQLARTQQAIVAAGLPAPRLVRMPYGSTSPAVEAQAADLGLRSTWGDVDPRDWEGPSTEAIISTVIHQAKAGSIVILHDGVRSSPNTVRALPEIIKGLRERGFCPGKVLV